MPLCQYVTALVMISVQDRIVVKDCVCKYTQLNFCFARDLISLPTSLKIKLPLQNCKVSISPSLHCSRDETVSISPLAFCWIGASHWRKLRCLGKLRIAYLRFYGDCLAFDVLFLVVMIILLYLITMILINKL